jgi:hypothetical protein
MFFLLFLPLLLASDWCEYQKLETHYSNTSKGNWIDTESSYFNTNLGKWFGYITRTLGSTDCPFGSSNPCFYPNAPLYVGNYTLPFSYCPNLTVSFYHKCSIGGCKFNLTICNQAYSVDSTNAYETNTIKKDIYVDWNNCPLRNLGVGNSYTSGLMYYDNFTISCDFKNSPIGSGITDEFYAYPKVYTEMGSLPNETYPNVTYRIALNMTDYTPSCSDYDNLNKYGLQTSTPYSIYPRDIGWIEQTTSCVGVDNQTIEQPHYSFINQTLQGGCKALVNYQNATLNCELIKFNTTIGSDTPTMTIISPLNDTSIPIYNPVSFAVNMSNNKCLDVYVISTKSGYSKLTILNSTDGYYYNGIDNLPNGTYTTNFICNDGCYGVYAHNVTNPIYFQVSTTYLPNQIKSYNQTECMSADTDLGKVASCYPNPITIPLTCSNAEVKEKTRIEYLDGYGNIINLDKCDSVIDGNFFNTNKFNMTSCIGLSCGSSDYYCNETYNSKSKVETDLSGVITGYSEAYVPIECRCYYTNFIILTGYKIAKYRVYGSLEMSCDNTCNGNWVCSSSTQKAYLNTSCQLTNITDCSYSCLNGVCINQQGIETNQTLFTGNSLLNKLMSWIMKPTRTQKMVMGFGGCIFFGVIGLALGYRFDVKQQSGLLFMIMFGIGFAIFTFIGWIPIILIVLIIASIGVYMLTKFL